MIIFTTIHPEDLSVGPKEDLSLMHERMRLNVWGN